MHGNVLEWTQDCWNDSYRGAPSSGTARTDGNCGGRVLRGGSWYFYGRSVRAADRSYYARDSRNYNNGFRLARTLLDDNRSESISDNTAIITHRTGQEVYRSSCFACHDTGAANAPKRGDVAAWSIYRKKGIDDMLRNTVSGTSAMPPRGTCANCSNDELRASIEYILDSL